MDMPGNRRQQHLLHFRYIPFVGSDPAVAHPLIDQGFRRLAVELGAMLRQLGAAPVNQSDNGQEKGIGGQPPDRGVFLNRLHQTRRVVGQIKRRVPFFREALDFRVRERTNGELSELTAELRFAVADNTRRDDNTALRMRAGKRCDLLGDVAPSPSFDNLIKPVEQKNHPSLLQRFVKQFFGQRQLSSLTRKRNESVQYRLGMILEMLGVFTDAYVDGQALRQFGMTSRHLSLPLVGLRLGDDIRQIAQQGGFSSSRIAENDGAMFL